MDLSNLFYVLIPFAKQNQVEVWPRFQSLLKLLLWTKGVDCVKVQLQKYLKEYPTAGWWLGSLPPKYNLALSMSLYMFSIILVPWSQDQMLPSVFLSALCGSVSKTVKEKENNLAELYMALDRQRWWRASSLVDSKKTAKKNRKTIRRSYILVIY